MIYAIAYAVLGLVLAFCALVMAWGILIWLFAKPHPPSVKLPPFKGYEPRGTDPY